MWQVCKNIIKDVPRSVADVVTCVEVPASLRPFRRHVWRSYGVPAEKRSADQSGSSGATSYPSRDPSFAQEVSLKILVCARQVQVREKQHRVVNCGGDKYMVS